MAPMPTPLVAPLLGPSQARRSAPRGRGARRAPRSPRERSGTVVVPRAPRRTSGAPAARLRVLSARAKRHRSRGRRSATPAFRRDRTPPARRAAPSKGGVASEASAGGHRCYEKGSAPRASRVKELADIKSRGSPRAHLRRGESRLIAVSSAIASPRRIGSLAGGCPATSPCTITATKSTGRTVSTKALGSPSGVSDGF